MVMREALELNLGQVLICKIIENVYFIFSRNVAIFIAIAHWSLQSH